MFELIVLSFVVCFFSMYATMCFLNKNWAASFVLFLTGLATLFYLVGWAASKELGYGHVSDSVQDISQQLEKGVGYSVIAYKSCGDNYENCKILWVQRMSGPPSDVNRVIRVKEDNSPITESFFLTRDGFVIDTGSPIIIHHEPSTERH
jgi:hypothetical protein